MAISLRTTRYDISVVITSTRVVAGVDILIALTQLRHKMGAKAYTLVSRLQFQPDTIWIEIGSERGEGSTAFLANEAKNRGHKFFTVDISPARNADAMEAIKDCPESTAVLGNGENFLFRDVQELGLGQISFLYLDNFDWIWEGSVNEQWIKNQVKEYLDSYGLVMNNLNSQITHLRQAMTALNLMHDNGVVLIDDTWRRSDGCYDGKGGLAAPYLVSMGFSDITPPEKEASQLYVLLGHGTACLRPA